MPDPLSNSLSNWIFGESSGKKSPSYLTSWFSQSEDERCKRSLYYLEKLPDCIPVVIFSCAEDVELIHPKFCALREYSVAQFIWKFALKNLIKLPENKTFFLRAGNEILLPEYSMAKMYDRAKARDGFLYLYLEVETK